MDIERINVVLSKAIVHIQEDEIEGLAVLAEQAETPVSAKEAARLAKLLEKQLSKPTRKWWPRRWGGGEYRWTIKPQKGAIYVSREVRGTDSWEDGLIDRTIPVWDRGDGTYKIASDRSKIASAKDFSTMFWRWWDWSVDD